MGPTRVMGGPIAGLMESATPLATNECCLEANCQRRGSLSTKSFLAPAATQFWSAGMVELPDFLKQRPPSRR